MTTSILIVDDHAVVRQGLRLLLEARPEIEVIGEAADGQIARTSTPDVILLDLLMPEMNGLQVLQPIKEHELSSRVLILTSSIEDHLVQQALTGGADGYILKTTRSSELIEAIKRVARGAGALDPAAARAAMRQTRGQDPLLTLTQREHEVFDHLARGRNSPEIAELLTVLLAHRPGNLFLLLAVAKSTYNRGINLRNSPLKIIKSLQTFPIIEFYANFLSKTSVH